MENMEEMPMEANLLETDIADASYNYIFDPTKSEESKKLLFRQPKSNHDKFKFSQKLADLEKCQNRCLCPKCDRKCKYYCPNCKIALNCTPLPSVKLPFQLDIIKHVQELDTKSTAIHAKVIAQDHVRIFDYPHSTLLDYGSEDQVFLVFPDQGMPIENHTGIDLTKTIKMVFIDATWKQAKQIVRNDKINNLPRISLQNWNTSYWRYQTKRKDDCLATIEAIYYLTLEFHTKILQKPYNGNYDDLLYLFVHFYTKIHALHGK